MFIGILHLNPGYDITWSDSTCQRDSLALVNFHNAVIIRNNWKTATETTAKKTFDTLTVIIKKNQITY